MSEILPYNPLAQISETFSWQTAVNPAWSAEERIALRDDPSLSITYSYAIGSDTKLADFYAFSETNLGIPVRIPMWSSPHFHPGSVLSAATSFSLTNSLLHFYLSPGDEVLLWKSATSYIALVISTISSGGISFTTSLGFDFSAFYILPLLTGRFNKAMNFTKGAGGRKRAGFVFDVLNFILPDPYSGYRVDKILQSSEFSTATKQDREIVKSDVGIYENLPTSALIKESWRGGFNFASPSDLVDFLILLKALKGRAVSFTFPYGLLSPTGTSTVVLSSDSVSIEHSFPRRASASVELEGLPNPTYEIYAASSSAFEGQTLGFTVLTTLVPDGTTLYYTILNITTEGIADVSPISGSVVISSGSATFNISILSDGSPEPAETFSVQLRTLSLSGAVVATSQIVTIVPSYSTSSTYYKYFKLVGFQGTEAQARALYYERNGGYSTTVGFTPNGVTLTNVDTACPAVIYFRMPFTNQNNTYIGRLHYAPTNLRTDGNFFDMGTSNIIDKAQAISTLTEQFQISEVPLNVQWSPLIFDGF